MKILSNLRKRLKRPLTRLEKSVGPIAKFVIGVAVISSPFLVGAFLLREKPADITASTVMITGLNGRSGGSGVIVSSSRSSSQVLTNAHVCQVADKGGLVKTVAGATHTILYYAESEMHDLCLITVAADLGASVPLAKAAPKMYDHAIISGHPSLLPNVITEGHFSGNRVINVFMGIRECTSNERKDDDIGFLCWFFGGFPVIKTFEAVLVTATIMPGSSGSAVYTQSRRLGALVFAGSGELGYAFAIPYEYVDNFLSTEIYLVKPKKPNYEMSIQLKSKRSDNDRAQLRKKCRNSTNDTLNSAQKEKIKSLCKVIEKDSKWREVQ